jgi:hypothetical protein
MFLVDNTSKLKDVMEFKNGAYYKFVCLVRAKDYKENSNEQVLHCMEKQEILVKDWLVDTPERLAGTLPDMLKFTELFKCRLYMCTDRKSVLKTLKTMRDTVQNYLDPFLGNPNASCSVRAVKKVASSASNMDESSDKGGRKWLFDVDTKDQEVLQEVVDYCGNSYESTFETKSGYHVVAKREFDAHRWVELEYNNVEVKENAMVLVAMAQ